MSAPSAEPRSVSGEAMLALAMLGVLAVIIVPLPAVLLDGMLALNIGLSSLMLLVALGLRKPLEFSSFPSLLLITTLFRLGLNVATTRLILLDGGKGPGAAGHVIETFGRFVLGGSLVVGTVVFLILLVVNFAVITKGSGRVSEVAARFTLDAMPGKQMAIDADLAAGAIDDRTAKTRRDELASESEFFGAMDGASKFVRGDAIAGLLITGINIVGGLVAGLVRDRVGILEALERYTILTVGDGLVTQIPALLVSTAAGILVTRASGTDLGSQAGQQLFGRPSVMVSIAALLGVLGILPGLPLLPFWALAGAAFALSRRATKAALSPAAKPAEAPRPEKIADVLTLETLEVEVGFGLVPLLDLHKGGELPGRVTALRRRIAEELGIVVPEVHLRDNLRLDANEFRVLLRGQPIGTGKAYADRLMVLSPDGGKPDVPGLPGADPAFGLPSVWIVKGDRDRAESRGFTVVDAAAVLATALGELLRRHAHELLGRQETQELLAVCAREAPKLVEDTVPGTIPLAELVRVLRGLLREGVSVRDLRTILEAISDASGKSKETGWLVEHARRRLARQLTRKLADDSGKVRALVIDRATEEALRGSVVNSEGEAILALDVDAARRLVAQVDKHAAAANAAGLPIVLLAPPDLRRPTFDLLSRFVQELNVISARELVPGTTVEPAGTVSLGARAA